MDIESVREQYREEGYAVIPDALSEGELGRLNALVDEDLEENPDDWSEPGSRGTISNGNLLMTHPELDEYVRHGVTFPLVEAVLGGAPRFAQLDVRDVPPDRTDTSDLVGEPGAEDRGFHRDAAHGDEYACLIYYLEDVHDCCPCFTVVPRTNREFPSFDSVERELGDEYEEVEIRGEAGTAILYDITIYHTRMPGEPDCPHGRRTLHNYHSCESNQPLVDWSTVPEELAMSDDPETRAFYSQWTPAQVEHARKHYEAVPTYYSKEYLVNLIDHFQPPR